MRCRSRARPAARSCRAVASVSASIGSRRVEREDRQLARAARSAVAIGSSAAVEPFSRNGIEQRMRAAEPRRRRDVEQRAARASAAGAAAAARGSCARRPSSRASATCTARGTNWSPRSSGTRITAASTPSTVDDRRRDGVERRVERQALRERARDLVERVHLPRRLALRLEHVAERLAELLRPLVQPRVLHGDRELGGERREQRDVALAERARARVGDEQPDRLVAHVQRHGERRALPGGRERRARPGERRLVVRDVARGRRRARAAARARRSSSRAATSSCPAASPRPAAASSCPSSRR